MPVPDRPVTAIPVPRVLVVADSADRTPEGIVLVDTVRWLTEHTAAEVRVLLFTRGPLSDEIEQAAATTVVADLDRTSRDAVIERLWFRLRMSRRGFQKRAARLGLSSWGPEDVVYLHSPSAVQALNYLPGDRPPVLCRLAESTEAQGWGLTRSNQRLLVKRVDRFLAETRWKVDELVKRHGVPRGRIHQIEPLIQPTDPRLPSEGAGPAVTRSALGIPEDAFLIGAYSPSPPEDPPDHSVALASLLTRRARACPLLCLWVADRESTAFWIEHDLERTGLGGSVRLFRSAAEMDRYFPHCDVLAYLSRLDAPVPHVYLEVAAEGTPLICFEGNELAAFVGENEGGFVVPYLDVVAVADAIVALAEDSELYQKLGEGAARRVLDRHGVAGYAARLWADLRDAVA